MLADGTEQFKKLNLSFLTRVVNWKHSTRKCNITCVSPIQHAVEQWISR